MYHELNDLWKALISHGLREDGWHWDWTTLGSLSPEQSRKSLKARLVAKSDGVFIGNGIAQAAEELAAASGSKLEIQGTITDGAVFKKGDVLQQWRGEAAVLLAYERTLLNLISFLGGIATHTRELVEKVRNACPQDPPRVTLTRKTLPHYREASIYAVRMGGGQAHRPGLSSGVLIKENHIAAAGGIPGAVQACRQGVPHGLKIEVEVTNARELEEALNCAADGVLLDNHSPEQVRKAVEIIQNRKARCFVEVSGGLGRSNIADYAIKGVDVLSVGSLTHSVSSLDVSLLIG